ncbi:MAG: ATP-binding protein [Epulopiscium sp.]|nr:ATP-binding protein [Candidatus Epulonipiscium sp.]
MTSYTKLLNNLEALKLEKIRSYLPNYIGEITEKELPFTEALLHLTEQELEFRKERASKIQISVSAFPFEKTLADFDFGFQPSINKSQLLDLQSLRFLENKENILFYGPSGVGKTHLA